MNTENFTEEQHRVRSIMPVMTHDRLYVLQVVRQENGVRSMPFVSSIKELLSQIKEEDDELSYVVFLFDVSFAAENEEVHPLHLVMDCPLFSVASLRAHMSTSFEASNNG